MSRVSKLEFIPYEDGARESQLMLVAASSTREMAHGKFNHKSFVDDLCLEIRRLKLSRRFFKQNTRVEQLFAH